MKQIASIALSLSLVLSSIFLIGCQDKQSPQPSTPETPEPIVKIAPFTLAANSCEAVEEQTITISYDQSVEQLPYFVGVVTKDAFATVDLQDEAALHSFVTSLCSVEDLTVVDGSYVYSGTTTILPASIWGIECDIAYVAFAVAFNSDGNLLTNVQSVEFMVETPAIPAFTVNINIKQIYHNAVSYELFPSDKQTYFTFAVVPSSHFDGREEVEALQAIIDNYIANKSFYPTKGDIAQGYRSNLSPSTDYSFVAFSIAESSGAPIPASAASRVDFTTLAQ